MFLEQSQYYYVKVQKIYAKTASNKNEYLVRLPQKYNYACRQLFNIYILNVNITKIATTC